MLFRESSGSKPTDATSEKKVSKGEINTEYYRFGCFPADRHPELRLRPQRLEASDEDAPGALISAGWKNLLVPSEIRVLAAVFGCRVSDRHRLLDVYQFFSLLLQQRKNLYD